MITNIVAGLITAIMIAAASFLYRHRGYLPLLRTTLLQSDRVRVSMSALLRVKVDDCYVLFHHPYRPSVYGPPGGVFKFTSAARQDLDRLSFVEQRATGRQQEMENDLRGFVPGRRAIGFMRWFSSGKGRESGEDCLRRELVEELRETNHAELEPMIADLHFELVRTVFEPPTDRTSMTARQFEIYDIVKDTPRAAELIDRLIAIGHDPGDTQIIAVSGTDIDNGRHGPYLVAPQSAFLMGDRRRRADLPAVQ
ncbi:hypothetical protein AB0C07_20465 [Actinoplanes missouriensis]|uniref:SMODS-associated NUDIX domain-containing protein n=1 Tax=Actinoplanes missouriensis TaxID=1866 RepID=UPI0033E04C4A